MSPESDSSPIRPEDLLAHSQWARALARTLVRDAATAEDLVQETWVAALEKPPRADRPLRPWLAGVLHNLARFRARGEGRRARREENAATSRTAVPSPEELSQKLESQRLLVDHVAQLEEPFRSTLLLRYYEELSAAEIARNQGVPAGTVRWRLKRALDTLRDRLDDAHNGDRRAWCLALLPLAQEGTGTPAAAAAAKGLAGSTILGVIAMGTTLKLTLGAVVIAAAALVLDMAGIIPLGLTGDTRDYDTPERVSFRPLDGGRSLAPRDAAKKPSRAAGEAPPAVEAPDDALAQVIGRVLDQEGGPVPGVLVSVSGTDELFFAESANDGAFELEIALPAEHWRVELAFLADGFAWTERAIRLERGQKRHLADVRLRNGGAVSGNVVDPGGRPVAGAWVGVSDPDLHPANVRRDRRANAGRSLLADGAPRATCDEAGHFTLYGVEVGLQRLWAGKEGYFDGPSNPVEVRHRMESFGLTIVVEPLGPKDRILGRVVTPDGEPVPHAEIEYRYKGSWGRSGAGSISADQGGRFEIIVRSGSVYGFTGSDRKNRWGPGSVSGIEGGSHDVLLRLPENRYLEIAATDGDGRPVPRFGVSLSDPKHGLLFGHYANAEQPGGVARVRLPALSFHVLVDADGYDRFDSGPLDPETIGERFEVAMVRLPGIRGRVTVNGAPIEGARVFLQEVVPEGVRYLHNGFLTALKPTPAARGATNARGEFNLTLRKKGSFRLRVESKGFARHESEILELEPVNGRDGLAVALTAGGMIEGVLTPAGGASPAGRIVGISRADGHVRTKRLGPDGRYRFEYLTPGPWLVRETDEEITPEGSFSSTSAGRAKPVFNTTVVDGRVTRFDLGETALGPSVAGTLRIEARPALGWSVALLPVGAKVHADEMTTARTDREGRFTLMAAEPGRYRLRLRAPDGELLLMDEIDLAVGTPLTWSRSLSVGTLAGTVPAASGEDAPNFALLWKGESGFFALALLRPDEEGRFQTGWVPVGKASIVKITRQGRRADPRTWPAIREVEID
ncbi:MAG: sigma-70 family RNA polymerase sigma factor [Planctomycetota bacterium]|nr:sigma-70 family RNA polymerase sigma factor [Planctomycetota bacterium]